MFQFRRFPTYAYLIQRRLTEYCSAGFPHSVIHGSTRMCRSPWLIAACHDLLRLLMPRHSPCALSSLTSSEQSPLAPFPASASGSRRKAPLAPLLLLSRTDPLRWAPFAFERTRAPDRSSSAPCLGSRQLSRIMQAREIFRLVALPFSSTISLWILCCLLHISGIYSSLFSFQGAALVLLRPD